MAEHMVGQTYVVYDGRADIPRDAALVYRTDDRDEAITRAQEQRGLVYAYDVTSQGELLHERLIFDGTKRA